MKLQPLTEFINEVEMEWKTRQEFILYSGEQQRFRISVESSTTKDPRQFAIGCWRDEELAKQGVSAACEDAKEFASNLINTVFEYLSPHQMQHVVNALQRQLNEWHEDRVKAYAANPEIFGKQPPTRIDEHCKD